MTNPEFRRECGNILAGATADNDQVVSQLCSYLRRMGPDYCEFVGDQALELGDSETNVDRVISSLAMVKLSELMCELLSTHIQKQENGND